MAKKIIDTAEWDRFVSENTESLDMSDHYDRGFADGLGVAEMFIDPLPISDEPRWIPVTERLPDPDEMVLAYCPCRKGTPSEIQTMRGWAAMIHASHWRPLPETPEVE